MDTARQVRRTARRLFKGCLVDAIVDEDRARAVAVRIIASKRRHGLAILSQFGRLLRIDRARHTATIESATLLPEDLGARISADLRRAHGPGLKTSFIRNPALIGGMRITMGSTVYDGSVRGRLAALEAQL